MPEPPKSRLLDQRRNTRARTAQLLTSYPAPSGTVGALAAGALYSSPAASRVYAKTAEQLVRQSQFVPPGATQQNMLNWGRYLGEAAYRSVGAAPPVQPSTPLFPSPGLVRAVQQAGQTTQEVAPQAPLWMSALRYAGVPGAIAATVGTAAYFGNRRLNQLPQAQRQQALGPSRAAREQLWRGG